MYQWPYGNIPSMFFSPESNSMFLKKILYNTESYKLNKSINSAQPMAEAPSTPSDQPGLTFLLTRNKSYDRFFLIATALTGSGSTHAISTAPSLSGLQLQNESADSYTVDAEQHPEMETQAFPEAWVQLGDAIVDSGISTSFPALRSV